MPAAIGWCSPITALLHACLPVRWGFASVATEVTPVETCHRHVSKSHLSNPQPPSAKQQKGHSFGMSFCFGGRWWIRTTGVIDDRFTVCSLWPLGKPSIFNYQLDWSWWTDLNSPDLLITNQLLYQLSYTSISSSRLVSATCLVYLTPVYLSIGLSEIIAFYFFRSIESDTCCRTVSSALDKSG